MTHKAKSDFGSQKLVKNQVWCAHAHQRKLKFETEAKATTHLKYLNPDEFLTGSVPIRSYHCSACNGWHVTSKELRNTPKTEEIPVVTGEIEPELLPNFSANVSVNDFVSDVDEDEWDEDIKPGSWRGSDSNARRRRRLTERRKMRKL